MQNEPGAFLSDPKIAPELVRADPFLVGGHKEDRLEPKVQRQLAIFKDRAVANRELLAAIAALVGAILERIDALHRAAMDAGQTIRPTDSAEVIHASLFVREGFVKIL